uniref:non-specific serine/threonine protein kinase n=1 Tax=Meloidogyne javanica TaxID=6303 RepID=A0A915LQ24_MELJA
MIHNAALNPLLHVPAQFPNRLFPTLYVGESTRAGGLYALPAYVDERTNRISPKYLGPPLLEGPKFEDNVHHDEPTTPNLKTRKVLPSDTVGTTYTTEDGEFLILGYHEVPKIAISGVGHIFSLTNNPFGHDLSLVSRQQVKSNNIDSNVRVLQVDDHNQQQNAYLSIDTSGPFIVEMLHFALRHPYQMSVIFSVMIALVIVSSWLLGKQSALTRNRSWSYSSNKTLQGSEIANPERGSRSSQGSSVFTAYEPPEEDGPLGWHRVNNSALSYNSAEILGRGCDGTVVYMGKFDDRTVAVKRIVSSNLDRNFRQQIEREVMHLRQSDSHPNVIRYFCSEADRYFHYIALELCDLSLSDYIQRYAGCLDKATKLDLMKQATDGIAHLHHINIIHRDVKPKNILMTGLLTNPNNEHFSRVRVKISDFGLCKSVKIGHNSISKVSGAVGTEGWMAPELFDADASVTYAVDVFSLGCVFYYTLTEGKHPFGDSLSRMSNILSGNHFLNHLDEHAEYTSLTLISSMLRPEAARRPTASAIASHPLFWEPSKQLQFLMEVSDWIEKKEPRDPVMRRLEWRRNLVFTNWLDQLDEPLRLDLLKQRQYMNNELPLELRSLLGAIPVDYLSYFTTRFPMLLMHSFMSLACIGNESVFKNYYSPNQLRDFYENEQMILFTSWMKERRSVSPTNWRSDGNIVSKQIQIVSQQQQVFASTILKSQLQVSFDPSIPPPPIIKQQISPILKISEENENNLNKKEESTTLVEDDSEDASKDD